MAQPTMLVVSRTVGCPPAPRWRSRTGLEARHERLVVHRVGRHGRPARHRPGATSRLPQWGQRGTGGWWIRPQFPQPRNRRTPSAPLRQKNSSLSSAVMNRGGDAHAGPLVSRMQPHSSRRRRPPSRPRHPAPAWPRRRPQLQHALVEEAETVQPAGRELAAPRVERQRAAEPDALAALDERTRLARPQKPSASSHAMREPAEAVVELAPFDVVGREVGPGPTSMPPSPAWSWS